MPALDFALPARFGRYTLVERVGGGGMATVYRASLSGEGGFAKEVAVKVVRPELAEEPQFVEMFLDEARISARLGHANLVHTFDFGQVDGTWFLAMEFVPGLTLAGLLRICRTRGIPLGAARSVHVAGEVARGLGYAHRLCDENGAPLALVHRDVSPQNVLLSREGEVKLADFGIAKAAWRSTFTRPGHVRGKCAYMAPEQARGLELDARADVFALGVVLWECLASRPLFDGATDSAVLLQVLEKEIAPPSRFAIDVPPELDRLVLRLLERDPARRPANGDEVARELAELKLRLLRSSSDVDLAAFLRSLSSGTAVLPAVGGAPGRTPPPPPEEPVAAEAEEGEEASWEPPDPEAETLVPERRQASGSGEAARDGGRAPALEETVGVRRTPAREASGSVAPVGEAAGTRRVPATGEGADGPQLPAPAEAAAAGEGQPATRSTSERALERVAAEERPEASGPVAVPVQAQVATRRPRGWRSLPMAAAVALLLGVAGLLARDGAPAGGKERREEQASAPADAGDGVVRGASGSGDDSRSATASPDTGAVGGEMGSGVVAERGRASGEPEAAFGDALVVADGGSGPERDDGAATASGGAEGEAIRTAIAAPVETEGGAGAPAGAAVAEPSAGAAGEAPVRPAPQKRRAAAGKAGRLALAGAGQVDDTAAATGIALRSGGGESTESRPAAVGGEAGAAGKQAGDAVRKARAEATRIAARMGRVVITRRTSEEVRVAVDGGPDHPVAQTPREFVIEAGAHQLLLRRGSSFLCRVPIEVPAGGRLAFVVRTDQVQQVDGAVLRPIDCKGG